MKFQNTKWNVPGAFVDFKLAKDPDGDLTYKNTKQK